MHDNASVVTLVSQLVAHAILKKASDVHCEPTPSVLRVRYRIDGVLYDQDSLPRTVADQVITHIKVMAHNNTSQKRIPQDGKFLVQHNGHTIDIRVSTFPGIHGEKVVMRILDRNHTMLHAESLGFSSSMLEDFTIFLIAAPRLSFRPSSIVIQFCLHYFKPSSISIPIFFRFFYLNR